MAVMALSYPRRRGMGDWQGDIAAAVAGDELNKLTKAIFGVQDSLVGSIEARNSILSGYQDAKAELASATQAFGPVTSPDSGAYSAQLAFTGAVKAVQVFARQVQTLSELWIIFSQISAALQAGGLTNDSSAVDATTYQLKKFVTESDALFAAVPEYGQTKQAIIQAFKAETALWGVDQNAYADPRWFGAFIKAADKVVELPDRATAPDELASMGVSGMGQLGNPMPLALAALIWTLVIVAGTVTLMYGIMKTLEALNSEAVTARQLILQRDQEKEALRAKLMADGKDQAEITTAMTEFDTETQQQVKAIPKSALAGLVLPLAIVGGTVFAAFILPALLKKL
jgi:hypothetical protein